MAAVLNDILKQVAVVEVKGPTTIAVEGIIFDSRKAADGLLFVAVKGTQADGHAYIADVVKKGVKAIVCETLPAEIASGVTYIKVADTTDALGLMADAFYGHPSGELKLVGITGTNGKTTTATLLFNAVRTLGFKAGLLSTVANYIEDRKLDTTHTTPDAVELNKLLREMVDEGCSYCFMEVSSHAIVQRRIAGLKFAGAIFSNITHDHLDYHKTFDEYIKAKKLFFDNLDSSAFALTNTDDRNGRVMVQNTKAAVHTYSLKTASDFKCKIIENDFDGMQLNIDGVEVWTRFIGEFNAYNLLAVYSTGVLLGIGKEEMLTILSGMTPVSGRFEYVRSKQKITAIVDYAHTPDALLNVVTTINKIRKPEQKFITVVGAGGNRDKTKRPEMARIAVENSDMVILTSDNPRNEKPEDILADMKAGVPDGNVGKVLVIVDRKEAIKTACAISRSNDIILVAGKGHENYQEVNGVKHHFDDKEVLREIFDSI